MNAYDLIKHVIDILGMYVFENIQLLLRPLFKIPKKSRRTLKFQPS